MKKLMTAVAAILLVPGVLRAQDANFVSSSNTAAQQQGQQQGQLQGQQQGQQTQFGGNGAGSGISVGNNFGTDPNGNGNGGGTNNGTGAGNSNGLGNARVTLDQSNHSQNTGSKLSDAVGIATAPNLTTTLTETCMGSTSFGGGFSGGSFSFGTTWRDHACVRRLDAREIKSFGDVQAAKEIMCDSDLVREAFKRVGRPCAEDGGSYVAVSQAPAPVVGGGAAPQTPAATDSAVHDDQDSMAQRTNKILDDLERAKAAQRY